MVMRLKHIVQVIIGRDVDLKNLAHSDDATLSTVQSDVFGKSFRGNNVVDATTTEVLSLGDIADVRGIKLVATGDPKLYLNGSTDAIQLKKAGSASDDVAKFFAEMAITSISVEAGATDSAVDYVVWGDPVS